MSVLEGSRFEHNTFHEESNLTQEQLLSRECEISKALYDAKAKAADLKKAANEDTLRGYSLQKKIVTMRSAQAEKLCNAACGVAARNYFHLNKLKQEEGVL